MTKNGFDLWQNHSSRYLKMAFATDKREIVKNPDGYGKRTGICGDTIEIFITVDKGRIQSVSYDTDGCMNTNACCNTLALLAEGKTIEQAWEIKPEDVVNYLQTLPTEDLHCTELTMGSFYLALSNYRELKQSPWKKLYQGN